MPSLTVDEVTARAASLVVTSYDIELDLTRGDETFLSRTTIEFRSVDRRDTFLDVAPTELHSVELNGRLVDSGALSEGRLPLGDLDDHNTLRVEATMAYSHDGEGLHRAVDPEDGLAYLYAMTFLRRRPRESSPVLTSPTSRRRTGCASGLRRTGWCSATEPQPS